MEDGVNGTALVESSTVL